MAIDKIEWHSGADNFPENLPYENGGNHIGYFMEYLYKHNFIPDHSNGECDIEEYLKVKNGEISGLKFLIENCDGKFWESDTNEEGLKFTNYVYEDYCYNIENILGYSPYERSYSNQDYQKIEKWLEDQFSIWETNGKPPAKEPVKREPVKREPVKKEPSKKSFLSKLFKK